MSMLDNEGHMFYFRTYEHSFDIGFENCDSYVTINKVIDDEKQETVFEVMVAEEGHPVCEAIIELLKFAKDKELRFK